MPRNLADAIIRQQQQQLSNAMLRSFQRGRIVLGGTSGSGGGSGGPPGGVVGQLIQTKVAYDTTEAEIETGSTSLVDNLNHIRYRINVMEETGEYGPHENAHTACGVDDIDSPLHPGALSSGSITEDSIEYDGSGRISVITQHVCESYSHRRTFYYAGAILANVVEEFPVGTEIANWSYIYNTDSNIVGVNKGV